MKNKLLILMALVGTAFGQGQYQVNAALSAQDSGACSTANACLILPLPSNQSGSAAIQLQGTFTATVQFEATADPEAQNAASTSWSAISGTPLNSTTTVTSATGTGIWRFSVGGLTAIRARVSSFGSGSVNTTVTAANVSAGLSGGGSGTVTSIATTSPITGGTITTTGTIACATCVTSATGGALTLDQVGNPAAAAAFNNGTNLVSFTGATGANRFSITNAGTAATDVPLVVNIPTSSTADIQDWQVNGAKTNSLASNGTFGVPGGQGMTTLTSGNLVLTATGAANAVVATPGSSTGEFRITQGNFTFSGGKGQHIKTQSAANDVAGTCTASASTTCTVTFTTAYTAAPSCIAVDQTNITTLKVTPSTTNLVITTSASSSDVFAYHCIGNPN